MLYIVDPAAVNKHKLTMAEWYMLMSIHCKCSARQTLESLRSKGYLGIQLQDNIPIGYFITPEALNILADIRMDSSPAKQKNDERITNLIPQLQAIYPEGKNLNGQYWRCNKTDLRRKLVLFLEKYGDYTDEQIIAATQAYVDSFKGSMKYMRLLKYFIWKEEIKDGSKVLVSELADIIENGNQVTNDDWTTELR